MPFSIKEALLSWQGSFVGKKRKKVQKAASLWLFWTLWKKRNRRAFEDSDLTNHAILRSFMYMFLEWVSVHLGSSTLFLFDFIDWLDYKWSKGVFFFVNPSLIWPCIHRAYFRHVLGTPLIQLLLPIQKKSVKMVAAPINSSILMLG